MGSIGVGPCTIRLPVSQTLLVPDFQITLADKADTIDAIDTIRVQSAATYSQVNYGVTLKR